MKMCWFVVFRELLFKTTFPEAKHRWATLWPLFYAVLGEGDGENKKQTCLYKYSQYYRLTHLIFGILIQQKPHNVIILGQTKSDDINRINNNKQEEPTLFCLPFKREFKFKLETPLYVSILSTILGSL